MEYIFLFLHNACLLLILGLLCAFEITAIPKLIYKNPYCLRRQEGIKWIKVFGNAKFVKLILTRRLKSSLDIYRISVRELGYLYLCGRSQNTRLVSMGKYLRITLYLFEFSFTFDYFFISSLYSLKRSRVCCQSVYLNYLLNGF